MNSAGPKGMRLGHEVFSLHGQRRNQYRYRLHLKSRVTYKSVTLALMSFKMVTGSLTNYNKLS